MKNDIMNELDQKSGDKVTLAGQGLHDGSQGVTPEHFIARIAALHQKLAASVRERSEELIRMLEAGATTLERLESQAQEHWNRMRQDHQTDPPQFFLPLLLQGLSLFALVAEAALLAPTMDMFGVTEYSAQLVLAGAFGIIGGTLFHIALEAQRKNSYLKIFPQASAVAMLMGLFLLGLMRARELAFAATTSGNPLAQFLASHPLLSSAVFSVFSVLFPVCGALALQFGMTQMNLWSQFRKARRNSESLKADLDRTRKQIEAEHNRLAHQLDAIDKRCDEWKCEYMNHWNLGDERGVNKGPIWPVWVKAIAAAIGMFIASFLSLTAFHLRGAWLISGLAAIATGLLVGVHFYREWEHPEADQLLKRTNLRFCDDSDKNLPPISFVDGQEQAGNGARYKRLQPRAVSGKSSKLLDDRHESPSDSVEQ